MQVFLYGKLFRFGEGKREFRESLLIPDNVPKGTCKKRVPNPIPSSWEHETRVTLMVSNGMIIVWKSCGFPKLLHSLAQIQLVHFYVLKFRRQRGCLPKLSRVGENEA